MTYIRRILCAFIYVFILLGCESKLLTVYKIDIQQGNAIETEAVNKIQLGMSKEQVRFVLGTPIIKDVFHPDRWDYIYHFTPGYGEQQRRQLTLFFDRDEVIDIRKDNIVAEDILLLQADKENNKKEDTEEKVDEEQEKLEQDVEELQEMLEKNKDANI